MKFNLKNPKLEVSITGIFFIVIILLGMPLLIFILFILLIQDLLRTKKSNLVGVEEIEKDMKILKSSSRM